MHMPNRQRVPTAPVNGNSARLAADGWDRTTGHKHMVNNGRIRQGQKRLSFDRWTGVAKSAEPFAVLSIRRHQPKRG
jgi:hypothetical protein